MIRTHIGVPKFREVFQQVGVEPPLVTLLVLNHSLMASLLLILAMAGSVFLTWQHGERRYTLWFNIGCFLASMVWLAIVDLALFAPFVSLFQGVGSPRPR
jgi:hypothetical protein